MFFFFFQDYPVAFTTFDVLCVRRFYDWSRLASKQENKRIILFIAKIQTYKFEKGWKKLKFPQIFQKIEKDGEEARFLAKNSSQVNLATTHMSIDQRKVGVWCGTLSAPSTTKTKTREYGAATCRISSSKIRDLSFS
jgi:hypothetical protein